MVELAKLNANVKLTDEQAREKRDKELRQACAAFEGMFMDMMMKTMRKASMESSLIKKSNGEKIFTEMLDQQYVDILAKTPNTGLGETLYKHLKETMPQYRDEGKNFHMELNPYNVQQKRQEAFTQESLDIVQ
ncbi:MAG: rod-binding protein [Mucispirillum sp.]|nr:rod-binding protein [Mucispirillum sp.]